MDQTHDSRPKVSWGPVTAVLITVGIYFLSQIIAVLLLSLYPLSQHWTESRTNQWYEQSLYAQFGLTLIVDALSIQMLFSYLKFKHAPLSSIGLKMPRLKDLAYALSGYAIYFAGYIAALQIVTNYVPEVNVSQKQELGFNTLIGGHDLIFVFISLVILPPIVEEILVRGFLFTGLRTKLSIVPAAIVTSLIFASAHLQLGSGNAPLWIAAIDTFLLSMVLVYLRVKTDSLAASMGLHMIKNGLAFASLFIFHVA